MKEKVKKLLSQLITCIFILSTIICINAEIVSAKENDPSILIKKVSKSYTKKFCNAIAFGLSKESAMNFSIKENNQVFENRKGFKDMDKELLSEEIAISVVEECGYPLKLSGEKGIEDFQIYYLSKYNEFSG
tara:strand:- start:103 stop:498 length:396 start_codon:yes stop_codon:yes gene_type:complete